MMERILSGLSGGLGSGADTIKRAVWSTWWEWKDGSWSFDYCWPEEYQHRIRDGIKIHFKMDAPQCVLVRIVLLPAFSHIAKGDDDIRMVSNGLIGGWNDAMWVPRFVLSTLNLHLQAVEEGTFMGDLDVGECFLNFMLHPSVRLYMGVDFTLFFLMTTPEKALEGDERDDGQPQKDDG
jgi:hypothetical protein